MAQAADQRSVALEPSWLAHLQPEFDKPYMRDLRAFLLAQKRAGRRVFVSAVGDSVSAEQGIAADQFVLRRSAAAIGGRLWTDSFVAARNMSADCSQPAAHAGLLPRLNLIRAVIIIAR